MPRISSAAAARSMKGWFMPAPAPCANTYTYCAPAPPSVFANELVEALQHAHEVGLHLKHFHDRVVAELLHPLQGVRDRPVAVMERAVDLVPFDRHRDGRAGGGPNAVGGHHELARAILEGIDVDLALAFADRALCGRDVAVPVRHE